MEQQFIDLYDEFTTTRGEAWWRLMINRSMRSM
jgi:hypothetical protein